MFMKRLILIFLCMLFLFAGCNNASNSGENTTKDVFATNYVGEGQLTVLRSLVSSNAMFVEEVFVEQFLPVDKNKTISDKSGIFAPVSEDRFASYDAFIESIYSTYTEEAAKKILSEFNMYKDIYGKLYLNLKNSEIKAENYDWSNPELRVNSAANGAYNIEVTVKTEKGKDHSFEMKAVTVDGNIRLKNIYY